MPITIAILPRPLPHAPEYSYYAALHMALTRQLQSAGLTADWLIGQPGSDHVRVESGDMTSILAFLKLLPYVASAVGDEDEITLTLFTNLPSPSIGITTPLASGDTSNGAIRYVCFPHPIGGAAISEAVALGKAGFTVTGFIVQDGAVTTTFTGAMTADLLRALTAAYDEVNESLEDEALNCNMFGDLVEGMAIWFSDGIPLVALESALVYARACVPVIGFAVKNSVIEPVITGPLTRQLLDDISQQFTIDL